MSSFKPRRRYDQECQPNTDGKTQSTDGSNDGSICPSQNGYTKYFQLKVCLCIQIQDIFYSLLGGMGGLQNMMRQLQQGAAGGLGNLMGGMGMGGGK